jgi:polar amino acid transport system permease protein
MGDVTRDRPAPRQQPRSLLSGHFIVLIKDSSLVSLISIQELTFMSSEVSSSTQRFFSVWLFTAALYFDVCFTCAMWLRAPERRWKLRT